MPIPVFYRPEMTVPDNASYSPSAGKPAAVVADWLAAPDIREHVEIVSFEPVDAEVIAQAHELDYVAGVMSGTLANGFSNRSPAVASSLLYTTGSLLAAAEHVLRAGQPSHGLRVAVSPTSGFHHAHYASGYGFCTFNGLVAAAMRLKRLGLAETVAIFDYDYHYGDGTDDIINRLGLKFIRHFTAGSKYRNAADAPRLLRELNQQFERVVAPSARHAKADVVLYQAGADQHRDDPLGGVLSDEQMAERDYQVFRNAALHGVPIVWNLAGGYRLDEAKTIAPVLSTHRATMNQCIRVVVSNDH